MRSAIGPRIMMPREINTGVQMPYSTAEEMPRISPTKPPKMAANVAKV